MSWHRNSFQDEHIAFDPYTTAEAVFVVGGCFSTIVAGCLLIGAVAEKDLSYLLGTLALGLMASFFFFVYSRLKDTVELDFSKGYLSCKRRLGAALLRNEVTRFEALHGIVVFPESRRDGKNGPLRWIYGIAALTKSGTLIKLTLVDQSDFEVAQAAAERLAERIGCAMLPGKPGLRLTIDGGHPPQLDWTKAS